MKSGIFSSVTLIFLLLAKFAVAQAPNNKPAPNVPVIKAQQILLHDEIEALGTGRANESIYISANITEKISKINFTDNQQVTVGDIIVELDHQAELAEKQAEELRLKEHQRELQRLKRLLKKQAINERQYDERKTLVAISKANLARIEAQIADHIITAPFSGVLGLRNISLGSLIDSGDIITSLDDIETLKIDFTVPALYLPKLQAGTKIATSSEIFPGETFNGEIAYIDSRVSPENRSIMLRAIIDNSEQTLKPGLLMNITLFVNERETLILPEETLTQTAKQHFVLAVNSENIVEKIPVTIGSRQNGMVEIIAGIDNETLVIYRGLNRIFPGQKVAISEIKELAYKP